MLLSVLALLTAAPIEVRVTGVESDRGLVHVDICPERGFLKNDCPWSGEATATTGTTIVTVAGVPPGSYAAQGFHDEDADHRPDRNLLGIPTERIGFSNDAPAHLGPPKWAAAAFAHDADAQTITFRVRRLP